jgi:hypothetical protein
MMLGVPGALLGADRALTHAGLKQMMHDLVVGLGGPRQDPRYKVAHIGARDAVRDACAHLVDVRLDQI